MVCCSRRILARRAEWNWNDELVEYQVECWEAPSNAKVLYGDPPETRASQPKHETSSPVLEGVLSCWKQMAQVCSSFLTSIFDMFWLCLAIFYHISTFGASNSSRSVGQWPKIPRTSHWVRDFNHAYKRLYMEVSINGGTPIYGWFISWKILL